MNSIGAFSPRAFLQEQLNTHISTGQIKSSDKDALTSALDEIGASLGGPPADKASIDDIASKIDSLISQQEKEWQADVGAGFRVESRLRFRRKRRSRQRVGAWRCFR